MVTPVELTQSKLASLNHNISTKTIAGNYKFYHFVACSKIKSKWVINLSTGELINLAAGHSYLSHQYDHISDRPIKGYEIIGSGPDVWVNDWDVTTVKN